MTNLPTTLASNPSRIGEHFHDLSGTARRLLDELRQAPLLLGWLIAGPLVALLLHGPVGLAEGMVNILLLGFWAVLIHELTPNPTAAAPVRRPRLELAASLALFSLVFAVQLFDFGVVQAEPWSGWVQGARRSLAQAIFGLKDSGIPGWALQDLALAAISTIKHLLPMVVVAILLGWRGRDMALQARGYAWGWAWSR